MRVLVANNRYFVSGGPERYMFDTIGALERAGHTVVPFSNTYSRNEPTPFARYFMPAPVEVDSVYYRDYRLTTRKKLELFARATYSFEAKRRAGRLIEDQEIDLAYLLPISNYISPSIIDACCERHVPVVMRLSDFNLLCPAYLFLRDGKPCIECLSGGLHRAVVHRCLQGSTAVSLARVLSMRVHQLLRIYSRVDSFVVPSRFMREQLIAGGFPAARIIYIPSPVELPALPRREEDGAYILYWGRISPEKGLETLVRAFEMLLREHPEAQLRIAGSASPEQERLAALIAARGIVKITFTGFVEQQHQADLFAGARLTISPSLWFENAPLSVYESHAHARAVVASRLGSLPEQVRDGVDGLLFVPGDAADLAAKMGLLWQNCALAAQMGRSGRDHVEHENTPETHYNRLLAVFDGARQAAARSHERARVRDED